MRSFWGTIITFLEVLQPSILSMALYAFLTFYLQPYIFAIALSFSIFQNISYCETNRLHFQSSIDYIKMEE